jgi:hypothetical protein
MQMSKGGSTVTANNSDRTANALKPIRSNGRRSQLCANCPTQGALSATTICGRMINAETINEAPVPLRYVSRSPARGNMRHSRTGTGRGNQQMSADCNSWKGSNALPSADSRCGCVVIGLSTRAAEVDISGTDTSYSQKQRKHQCGRDEEYRTIGQKITNSSH